ELPELAENGNTVPLSVAVLPGEGAYVQEVLVVAPENPNARVIRFRFSALSVPEASTRIRLAATQDVIAVAQLSDGTFFSASLQINVTIGGCGGWAPRPPPPPPGGGVRPKHLPGTPRRTP